MNVMLRPGLTLAAMLLVLLSGCAGTNQVRGQLRYDLRPEGARQELVWPAPPDIPRFRYLGELVGEPNFVKDEQTKTAFKTALYWIAGLLDKYQPVLLQRPQHGTVGNNGRIYVVDSGRNAVLVFDPKPPAEDESNDKGGQMLVWEMATSDVRFETPIAAVMAWNGELAVSDAKLGAVVRLNAKGEPVGRFAPDALKRPTGLAFDQEHGMLFVADTAANDIKVFDASGRIVRTFGTAGSGQGEFNAPTHLAFANQQLYVSDTLNSRVQIFSADGQFIRQFGERGLYVGNLARPKGVAVGNSGVVYVVESYYNHLLAYSQNSELLLGITGSGSKGDRFLLPAGVWTDGQGRLFVADMFNSRVVMFQAIDDQKIADPIGKTVSPTMPGATPAKASTP